MFRRALHVGPLTAGRPARGLTPDDFDRLVKAAGDQAYRRQLKGRDAVRSGALSNDELVDFLFATPGEPKLPEESFGRLRWGGVFAYIGSSEAKVRRLAEQYDGRAGFDLEHGPAELTPGPVSLRRRPTPTGYWFSARKTQLIRPGEITDRFTYDVELSPDPRATEGYVVSKSVPSFKSICYRLHKRVPEATIEEVQDRARKLVEHVFPTFLTREAAFLRILERDLSGAYRRRVPRLLGTQKDDRGFVQSLRMNWLRTGGEVLSQLAFARQAADLLTVLHDRARVMHLDLRLDNFVLTPAGVGFVDFGSAVRVGEDLSQSPMLTTLFTEMMRTSQIQRMLGRMVRSGKVTSAVFRNGHRKVDKSVDSFYLAVQINRPTTNPEFGHLIHCDPDSAEARALSALTAAILRPKHPDKTDFKSAADILRGIRRIEQRLAAQAA